MGAKLENRQALQKEAEYDDLSLASASFTSARDAALRELQPPASTFMLDGSEINNWEDTTKLHGDYEGMFDQVPTGELTLSPENHLYVTAEAEWVIRLASGRAFAEGIDENTEVMLQGMVDAKELEQFENDPHNWGKASLGNNVIAAGPGFKTTLGAISKGGLGLNIEVEYKGANGETQKLSCDSDSLKGMPIKQLIEEIVSKAIAEGKEVIHINLSATDKNGAFVNDLTRRIGAAAKTVIEGGLGRPDFKNEVLHNMAENIIANGEYADGKSPITIKVEDNKGALIGEGRISFSAE